MQRKVGLCYNPRQVSSWNWPCVGLSCHISCLRGHLFCTADSYQQLKILKGRERWTLVPLGKSTKIWSRSCIKDNFSTLLQKKKRIEELWRAITMDTPQCGIRFHTIEQKNTDRAFILNSHTLHISVTVMSKYTQMHILHLCKTANQSGIEFIVPEFNTKVRKGFSDCLSVYMGKRVSIQFTVQWIEDERPLRSVICSNSSSSLPSLQDGHSDLQTWHSDWRSANIIQNYYDGAYGHLLMGTSASWS